MADLELDNLIVIVTGAAFRAEEGDRPLAYGLAEEIAKRLPDDSSWRAVVISDVLYLNDEKLAASPTISLGGPGVNSLSAILYRRLPSVLTIDNVMVIQMDVEVEDKRCCLWGMNHEQTVEAIEMFLKLGHLDHFLAGVTGKTIN
jgi:hypothetical protein